MTDRSLLELARAWLTIGTQSVGGGASTLYLIRQVIVDRRGWLTHREFLEEWALSRLSLGVHLIAMTGLIGQRLAGERGVAVSVLAMVLPASVITTLMTAGYAAIRDQPLVGAILAGIGPATAGLATGMAIVLIRSAAREGSRGLVDWVVAGIAAATGLLAPGSPLPVIAAGIVVGAVLLRGGERQRAADGEMS